MYQKNILFDPPAGDAALWRYMGFSKFLSLLNEKALFFARADKLGDPFEGSSTKPTVETNRSMYSSRLQKPYEILTDVVKYTRETTLINCWHECEYESAAMWKLYSDEMDGVAIRTTFENLAQSFTTTEEISIGKVKYLDYDQDKMPEEAQVFPYLIKRNHFEHEREVRAINWTSHLKDSSKRASGELYDVGRLFEVDLTVLIQEIVVSPLAGDWQLKLTRSIVNRLGLNVRVIKSSLDKEPAWG